jgi:hypothetical protein
MPTPFMHLQMAERICASARLEPTIRDLLLAEYPAFYLGNVAPDFQAICDIPREVTHFYNLPPDPATKGYNTMFAQNPGLLKVQALSPRKVAFLAGYSIHLMLDLRWYHEALIPYFLLSEGWTDRRQRFIIHNALLTYLDMLAVESLPERAAEILGGAVPDYQLPFAKDSNLIAWRDMLVEQLQPGAMLRTIEIYSGRLSMSPEEFAANLEDPAWMADHVFGKVPVDKVESMLLNAVDESIDIITGYLTGKLDPASL